MYCVAQQNTEVRVLLPYVRRQGAVYLLERAVVQSNPVLQEPSASKRSVMRIQPAVAQQRQACFVPEINSFCVAAGTHGSGNASRGEVENMRGKRESESESEKTSPVILSPRKVLDMKGFNGVFLGSRRGDPHPFFRPPPRTTNQRGMEGREGGKPAVQTLNKVQQIHDFKSATPPQDLRCWSTTQQFF